MHKKKKGNIPFFKKVLHDLFLEYKRKLRLNKKWNISFKVNELDPDRYAEVQYYYDKRKFEVFISREMNETVNSLKDSIIHEFWHILLSPMKERFEKTLDKIEQGKPINVKKLRKVIQNEDERMVRKFTRIIIDLEKKKDK